MTLRLKRVKKNCLKRKRVGDERLLDVTSSNVLMRADRITSRSSYCGQFVARCDSAKGQNEKLIHDKQF